MDGERVGVIFTRMELFIPPEWKTVSCRKLKLYGVPDHDSLILCYRDDRGFYIFFTFSNKETSFWCSFIGEFLDRFHFLLGFVQNEVDVPFLAVLFF